MAAFGFISGKLEIKFLIRFIMPERMAPGPVSGMRDNCEAVCIHTKKIFDSCRDKDCIEDLRFYPTTAGQDVLSRAQTVKGLLPRWAGGRSSRRSGSRGRKSAYPPLGQFSIIRLERDTQLLIPVYDYCMPDKDCSCGGCALRWGYCITLAEKCKRRFGEK